MDTVTYGFVDNNNILFNTAVVIEGDNETIQRIKTEYGAYACYKIDPLTIKVELGHTYWNEEESSWLLLPPSN